MPECETTDGAHSSDLIEIWHGKAEPMYLCGKHDQSRRYAIDAKRDTSRKGR